MLPHFWRKRISTSTVPAAQETNKISSLIVDSGSKTAAPPPPKIATPEAPAKAEEIPVASFTSILSDIGNGLKKAFTVLTGVAQAAEPFVDLATAAMPGVPALYNATVSAAITAEAAAVTAGAQTGTGAQKLAFVVASITSSFNAYATANGLATPTQTTIEAYVNAVVASLNAIPASATTTAPTTA